MVEEWVAKLYKTSEDGALLLAEQLELAESFWARAKGLLGRSELKDSEVLWIKPCNNIHTFFMSFAIDCIFIDKKMEIKKLVQNVKPFKLIGPFWKAHSVIETKMGFIDANKLKIGDQLYVVN